MYASAADYFVYIGFLGLAIIFILLMVFLVRRLLWLFGMLFGMSVGSPNYKSAFIKFSILMIALFVFGAFTYVNFFERAYPKFEKDKVCAQVDLSAAAGENSSITIYIQRDEKNKSTQGATIHNDKYLLVGDIITPPDWLRTLGVKDGFRFYGLIKGYDITGYYDTPVDINVSEKPNDFIWKTLTTILDIIPIADIEKHVIKLQADGYNSKFDVYVSIDGFKRN
jgi:hypothetical protein